MQCNDAYALVAGWTNLSCWCSRFCSSSVAPHSLLLSVEHLLDCSDMTLKASALQHGALMQFCSTAEMAPAKLRGTLNVIFQLLVTIGAHHILPVMSSQVQTALVLLKLSQ